MKRLHYYQQVLKTVKQQEQQIASLILLPLDTAQTFNPFLNWLFYIYLFILFNQVGSLFFKKDLAKMISSKNTELQTETRQKILKSQANTTTLQTIPSSQRRIKQSSPWD